MRRAKIENIKRIINTQTESIQNTQKEYLKTKPPIDVFANDNGEPLVFRRFRAYSPHHSK
jgi:hypothetical protein